jgi:hypothetical protein
MGTADVASVPESTCRPIDCENCSRGTEETSAQVTQKDIYRKYDGNPERVLFVMLMSY